MAVLELLVYTGSHPESPIGELLIHFVKSGYGLIGFPFTKVKIRLFDGLQKA
jgi:hypothetical protein